MQKTMNYRRFLGRVALMLAVFLGVYLLLSHQLTENRTQENALRQTLIRLEDQNTELDAQLKLVDTEDYIVTSAMTNYAFMNKDDLRFQFTNPDALYGYTEEELNRLMEEMAD